MICRSLLSVLGFLSLTSGLLVIGPSGARGASYHVIICGSGGNEGLGREIREWGIRLRELLRDQLEVPESNVRLMLEAREGAPVDAPATSLEAIRELLTSLTRDVMPQEDLYLYLIGHGSYLGEISKFHVPGPDLSAPELRSLLTEIEARRIVVVNAASSSAGFINELSAPDTVIFAATKSAEEKNATEFMEFFLQGLNDGSADRNRDERISVLEACAQAASLTAEWYDNEGFLATEHALLDDNGDGLGSRLPLETEAIGIEGDSRETLEVDGALASTCFLKNFSFPPSVSRDLIERYLSLLDQIEELKREKARMDASVYDVRLESLLLEAARANREIRRRSDPAES